MKKELYVVYFDSANYMGYGEHCLVWAIDEGDAKDEAYTYANDLYFEQDSDLLEEEGNDLDNIGEYANIISAEPVAGSDKEKFINDPSQGCFYPLVNTEF